MDWIKLVFNQDFLLFFLGVYGPQVAKYTQTLITKCDTNVFTFLFTFLFLLGVYIVISLKKLKIK